MHHLAITLSVQATNQIQDNEYVQFTLASFLITLMLVLTIVTYPVPAVASGSNPNLFVSAENSQFENHFSGSMVIEVIVIDPDINYVDQIERHPYITINGDSLQMVQAVDGNWYAYFANLKRAQEADSTVGMTGRGLDFGAFCSNNTPSSVFGVSFPQTQGFAIPRIADGSTHGTMELSICTDTPSGPDINNVLRHPRPINIHPGVPPGQIGLDPDAWPLIQLFSFKDVSIMYNPGGRSQQVSLEYDEIPNISMSIDRKLYPGGSHVFLTVNDFQLNQDPTDRDSLDIWRYRLCPLHILSGVHQDRLTCRSGRCRTCKPGSSSLRYWI